MTQQIKITWKAFGDKPEQGKFVTSVEFGINLPDITPDNQILNSIYQDTNLYKGFIWNFIEPKLSPFRTHTALSVGDEVEINGVAYVVGDFGFVKVEDADIQVIDIEGRKVVVGVSEKVNN
jgi:hypothetical protein